MKTVLRGAALAGRSRTKLCFCTPSPDALPLQDAIPFWMLSMEENNLPMLHRHGRVFRELIYVHFSVDHGTQPQWVHILASAK